MSIKFQLDEDYEKKLKKTQGFILTKKESVKGPFGASIEQEVNIPIAPLNTSITFSKYIREVDKLPKAVLMSAASTLPRQYTWRGKRGISPVGNQALCGSCWAYSTAQVISDVFAIKNKYPSSPNISVMYLLTCYPGCRTEQDPCNRLINGFAPSRMCGGGNPAQLAKWVSFNGCATDRCVNYDACLNNPICSGKATQHFNTSPYEINKTLPSCGCYVANNKHDKFFIDPMSVRNHFVNTQSTDLKQILPQVQDCITQVKKHIFEVGPVIGGYHVLGTFMGSNLSPIAGQTFRNSKNPGGIYLDMVNYRTNTRIPVNQQVVGQGIPWLGGHAVAIVGWGVEKVDASLLDPNVLRDMGQSSRGMVDVPYWECRNSWSERWGDNGYFKIAMFPYNRVAQFEVAVYVNGAATGGMISFRAGKIEKNSKFPQNDKKFFNNTLQNYFSSEEELPSDSTSNIEPTTEPSKDNKVIQSTNNILYILGGILLCILLIIFLHWVLKNNKKSKRKNTFKYYYY